MLVFLLFFQSFGLGVNAADEAAPDNLIDSNLSTWTDLKDIDSEFLNTKVTIGSANSEIYRLTVYANTSTAPLYVGVIFDESEIIAGRSYTFSFYLPNLNEINSAFEKNYDLDIIENHFVNCPIYIGLGYVDGSGDFQTIEEYCFFNITGDNYYNHLGKTLSASFVAPNISGTPAIYIIGNSLDHPTTHSFYFSSFSLVDTGEEITEEENDSILDRLFEWFQERFETIYTGFQNIGAGLNELKDGFINKITELKESFQLKIEELKLSVINLGDTIINGIKGLFIPDETYLLQWKANLEQLLKDNLGIIYTCGDLFVTIIQEAFEIISDAPDTYEIKIPEVSFDVNGTRVPVFTAQSIDFSFMEKPVFRTMYNMYTVALYIFFGGLEVRYALRVKDKVMSN